MKAVVQRTKQAEVTSKEEVLGQIQKGMVVLLGVGEGDDKETVQELADEILDLRIFPSADKNIDRSILEVQGEILVVPQFTLYADTSKGNRPSFREAAEPDKAKELYLDFVSYLEKQTDQKVASGKFGAMMDVSLVNDGPVTIILEE